jgi:hypothetical protein
MYYLQFVCRNDREEEEVWRSGRSGRRPGWKAETRHCGRNARQEEVWGLLLIVCPGDRFVAVLLGSWHKVICVVHKSHETYLGRLKVE